MSGLKDSVEALERQLTGLQMQRSPATGKKIPPPPPPKTNRAQPQVPTGASRAYSASLSSSNNTYGNVPPPPPPPDHMYGNMALPIPSPSPPAATYYTQYEDENHMEHPLPPPSPVSSNYSELMQATHPYQQQIINYPTYQNCGDHCYKNSAYESIYEPVEPSAALQAQTYRSHRLNDIPCVQSPSLPAPQPQYCSGYRYQISHSEDRDVPGIQSPSVPATHVYHYAADKNQDHHVSQCQSPTMSTPHAYCVHRNQNFSEAIGVPVHSPVMPTQQAQYYSPHKNQDHYAEHRIIPHVQPPSTSVSAQTAHALSAQQTKQYTGQRSKNFSEERGSQSVQLPSVPAQHSRHYTGNRKQNNFSKEQGESQVHSPLAPAQQSEYYARHRNQINYSKDRAVHCVQSPSMSHAQVHGGLRSQKSLSKVGVPRVQSPYRNGAGDRRPLAKEAEVDALTQLLVQSIGEGTEPDTYGLCVRCHCPVKAEESGCTAMDQIYHVSCFTCVHCSAKLQGVTFYAVDGQPHCEQDYLRTLEKCSVCSEPIKDRILRATGKPYHPACFVCVACGKSLDGIPFTVDAANQIHCIEDFHNKFAPRCCVCAQPIMPEEGQEETVRIVALDRSFHVNCYRCEDCGLLLSSEEQGRGCYPLDDHILCKTCNAQRVRNLSNVVTTDL